MNEVETRDQAVAAANDKLFETAVRASSGFRQWLYARNGYTYSAAAQKLVAKMVAEGRTPKEIADFALANYRTIQ